MTTEPIKDGLPTGEGTSPTNDVADPHPATEEDYDKIPRPGGAKGMKQPDIGSNTYAHDGTAPPVSQSKGSAPQRKPHQRDDLSRAERSRHSSR